MNEGVNRRFGGAWWTSICLVCPVLIHGRKQNRFSEDYESLSLGLRRQRFTMADQIILLCACVNLNRNSIAARVSWYP